jgi:fumarate hydratase class I
VLKLRDGIVELYKKVATSIPKDVEDALRLASAQESDLRARESLDGILKTIANARVQARPVCEDTGFPVFFVKVPKGLSQGHIRDVIAEATRIATQKIPLRPNAVDTLSGRNTGDNVGDHFPLVYMEESEGHSLVMDLMLRGADCENLGLTYALPATIESPSAAGAASTRLVAERDAVGVSACMRDAVAKAQRNACPPFMIGVAIGGARDQVAQLSKRQLLRRVNDTHPIAEIAQIETSLLNDLNDSCRTAGGAALRTTAIGVKMTVAHRHPDSYFVDVAFSCWAHRRGRLIW